MLTFLPPHIQFCLAWLCTLLSMFDLLFNCFTRRHNRATDLIASDREIHLGFPSKSHVFSFEEISKATGNFHPDNKLGVGGFGAVYKGTLEDGTQIAAKSLSVRSNQGESEFLNEINLLTAVQHRNLVNLLGCSIRGPEKVLVYEYLPNKSLDRFLFGNNHTTLEWPTRREIIMGTAKGLSYLHEDSRERIVHRDIKASNILLDEKLNPKIADFGLARIFTAEETHISTRVAGTFGYLAPEYALNGKLTEKADVYSFGVLTLEITSGRKHYNHRLPPENQRLTELAWRLYEEERLLELADPSMGDRKVGEEVVRVMHIALLCTQDVPELRPSMSRVVMLLSGHSKIVEKPNRPAFMYIGRSPTPEHKRANKTSHGSRGKASTSLYSSTATKGSTASSSSSSSQYTP